MEQNKFKGGDRVKCVASAVFNELYEVGTIIDKMAYHWLVEFDNDIGGHNGLYDTVCKGKQGHCVYQVNDALVLVTDFQKILITTNGTTTTAKLLDGKKEVKTASTKCNPNYKFDFMTGAKLAFERLTEEKKEQPKPKPQEAVKLYCVKSDEGWLTKGKVYEFNGTKVNYDNGKCAEFENFDDWKREDSGFAECLFPLVKRPAKVGEWVLVVSAGYSAKNEDGTPSYKNGDILKIIECDLCWYRYRKGTDKYCSNYILEEKEYLVLDGYHGDPEAEKKAEEIAKLKKRKAEIEARINELEVMLNA